MWCDKTGKIHLRLQAWGAVVAPLQQEFAGRMQVFQADKATHLSAMRQKESTAPNVRPGEV